MNEFHSANQHLRLSLECCAPCTCEPSTNSITKGKVVQQSSWLAGLHCWNYQRCLFVVALPKCSWSSSCMLRRGSYAHGPSSELRPVETSSVRVIIAARKCGAGTSPIRPHHPRSTCPSGRSWRIDECKSFAHQSTDIQSAKQCKRTQWAPVPPSHHLQDACALTRIPIEEA